MKRKLLSIIIAILLLTGVLPLTVSAEGAAMIVYYLDVETMKPIKNLSKTIETKPFVFERPDGTTFELRDGHSEWGNLVDDNSGTLEFGDPFDIWEYNGKFREYIDSYLNMPGKYILQSFPVPDGYEVVEVFSGRYRGEWVENPITGLFEIWQGEDKPFVDEYNGFVVPESRYGYAGWSVNFFITLREVATPQTATPTASTVLVNGKNIAFDAYNIGGNNYFKLRDLAYILNGTQKQFQVSFNEATSAIILNSGQSYTPVGGEMAKASTENKTANPTTSKIYLDGKEVQFTAYNIDGNNYFKLRDVGETFDFGVDWDGANNTIVIDTAKDYNGQTSTAIIEEPDNPIKSMFDASTFGSQNVSPDTNGGWSKFTDITNFPQGADNFTYAYRCLGITKGWGGRGVTLELTSPQNSMSFTLARSDTFSSNAVTFTITDLDNNIVIYQTNIMPDKFIEVKDLNISGVTKLRIHAVGTVSSTVNTPATLFVLNPTVK